MNDWSNSHGCHREKEVSFNELLRKSTTGGRYLPKKIITVNHDINNTSDQLQ